VLKEWETAHGSLLKAMLARRKTGGARARLMSLQRGMGMITAALSDRLDGALRVQAPVVRIEKHDGGWRLGTSTGSSIDADRVVCALPSHVASAAAAGLDRDLAAALASIPYAPIAVVAIGYPRSAIARPLDGYGYLVTRQQGLFTLGVLWESSIFPGRAPANHVLLRVMLGGARHPQVRELDDESVASLAVREASTVLGITGAPACQWVFRYRSAIAQYTVGHDGRTAAIRRALGAHRGLHVCGTAYDGVSFNDAVASARRTARQVIEELVA
jgi:oxygen-dependent protoporphyrinogen oxidase